MSVKIHKGKALVLRTCKADMTAHGGFVWPESGPVEALDWEPTPECGNGLHGALWGEGNGALFNWDTDAVWQVVEIAEWIDLGGKVKFPRGVVVHTGDQKSATDYIIANGARGAVIGATVSGGNGATVSGGDGATVSGGYRATVSGGYGATVSGGDGATVSGGYRATVSGGDGATVSGGNGATVSGGDGATVSGGNGATVSGGYRATVSGGYRATVSGGDGATVSGGDGAILSVKYYDGNRYRLAVGYVGENGIKPNTPYRVNDKGEFVEVTP